MTATNNRIATLEEGINRGTPIDLRKDKDTDTKINCGVSYARKFFFTILTFYAAIDYANWMRDGVDELLLLVGADFSINREAQKEAKYTMLLTQHVIFVTEIWIPGEPSSYKDVRFQAGRS